MLSIGFTACNNKPSDEVLQKAITDSLQTNTAIKNVAAPNTDFTLRTQSQSVISKYKGIQADMAGGIVVMRGSINCSQLQPLMTELSTLSATKIDNQLAVH